MDASVRRLLEQVPLDAEQEHRLARRMRAGDVDARAALVLAGMRSVVQRALMHGLRGEDLRDGVQAGAVGLIQAVDRFDPDRGARLATYAWAWIGGAMRARPAVEVPMSEPAAVETGAVLGAAPTSADRLGECAEVLDVLGLDVLGPDELGVEVLRLRHGVGGLDPMSRREVGEHLGLTPSRVRAVETEAMRQLRVHLGSIGDRASPSGAADPL